MLLTGLRREWMTGGKFEYKEEMVRLMSVGVLMNASGPKTLYRFDNGKTHSEPACLCCLAGRKAEDPKACPICGQELKGKGWGGMAQHWKARHADLMPYDALRSTLCKDHQ